MYFCKQYAAEASGLLQTASCSWFLQFFEAERKTSSTVWNNVVFLVMDMVWVFSFFSTCLSAEFICEGCASWNSPGELGQREL